MPRYCHNRPLGTTPNAKIRIPTLTLQQRAAPCQKLAAKMSQNAPTRRRRHFGSVFRLF